MTRGATLIALGLLSLEANADVNSAVDECSRLIQGAPVGLPALEQSCPQLHDALQSSGIRPLIIESSRDLLSRASLLQLPQLIRPALGPVASVSALAPVLRSLPVIATPTRPWWQRLLDWLSERLGGPQRRDLQPWLGSALQYLASLQWLWNGIIWSTIIALPIAVLVLVRKELRARGRRSIDARAAVSELEASGAPLSQLALLRQLPAAQRPAQLFALLISRLVAAGRLTADRSLTHREVTRRALLEDAQQRRLIESLARASERQLYSGLRSAPAGIEELVARAEDLYITGFSPRSL